MSCSRGPSTADLERLLDLGTYYRLICAKQPSGYQGTNDYLDLDVGQRLVESALEAVFRSVTEQHIAALRRPAFANAYLTLDSSPTA
jgi:hypothetical protein